MTSVGALGFAQAALHMKQVSLNRTASPKMQTMDVESTERIGAESRFWNCWNACRGLGVMFENCFLCVY